jgi:hypothetical protein
MYRFSLKENEQILKKGEASLHIDDVGLTGALYLTNERLVFVGFVLGAARQHEKAVLLQQIRELKTGKTFFIIPNVLEITIDDGERLNVIVRGRDEWLAAIRSQMALKGKTLDT